MMTVSRSEKPEPRPMSKARSCAASIAKGMPVLNTQLVSWALGVWVGIALLLGLAESFLYGAYVGLLFCPVYNWLDRRWGQTARSGA